MGKAGKGLETVDLGNQGFSRWQSECKWNFWEVKFWTLGKKLREFHSMLTFYLRNSKFQGIGGLNSWLK